MIHKLQTLRRRLGEFLSIRLWDQDTSEMSRVRAFLFRQLRVLVIFAKGFGPGRIQIRAQAMTFTTLLTMGPVLVIALSMVQAFGALQGLEKQLEGFLIDNLSAGSQAQVRSWLYLFFESVRSGAFRELSILVLLGGVLGLLGSLEAAFNDIWGVHRGRSIFQRFSIYTTLTVFGPILVGLSLSLTASLETSSLRAWLEGIAPWVQGVSTLVSKLVPAVFTGVALTLLYTIMPNVRVRLRASLPAGLVAGFLWEISKFLYAGYMRTTGHYGTLYGSLAAIPLFLFWVYVSWLVVLSGAQLAFARDAAQDFRLEEGALRASYRERLRVALHIALSTARSYLEGKEPTELARLARTLGLPLRLVRGVAEDLVEGKILHFVAPLSRETGLVPARSPESITVYDVMKCLYERGVSSVGYRRAIPTVVEDILSEWEESWKQAWGSLSLKEMIADSSRAEGQGILPFPGHGHRFRPRPPGEQD